MSRFGQQRPVAVAFRESGFGLLESHHAEGFFMDWREDPFAKVILVVGGEGTLYLPGVEFAIRAPALVVAPPGARHRIADRPGRPLSLVGVCLRHPEYPDADLAEAACGQWRIEPDTPLSRRLLEWIRVLLVEERLQKPGAGALQDSLVCRIIIELARTPARMLAGKADAFQRVGHYVGELDDTFWKIDDLGSAANSLGLSRRRFTQIFREITGESWLARVCRLRLDYAARLLRTTDLSVRSIAFEAGYGDLAHFHRSFKGRFGESPGVHRRTAKR